MASVEAAVSVSVDAPLVFLLDVAAAMLVELKLAVSPVGSLVAASVTAEPKLLLPAMLMLVVAVLPCTTETELGVAATVKVGVGTVTATVEVLVTPPPVAVTTNE